MSHYLDYAATSAIRPPAVVQAMVDFMATCGGTPGRGSHQRAVEAGRVALRARKAVAEVLGVGGDPGRVVFTHNATHALNLALAGLLASGDRVVATDLDHNASWRPLNALERRAGVKVRRLPCTPSGDVDVTQFDEALDGARLVVLTAASNVLGSVLPVADLAARARDAGALVLVDAAQTAGHLEQDLRGADLIAVTGHKGLLGPQGTGALWVRPGLDLRPLLFGGAGGDSLDADMPPVLPDRLEAGTLNGPGLAGLEAGCRHVLETGVASAHVRLRELKARLRDGLGDVPGVTLLSPPAPEGVPIVTLTHEAYTPGELSSALERRFGVQARAGLHCAPGVHRLLGTSGTGALRFSLGWASTAADVDRAVEGVAVLAAEARADAPRDRPGPT